MPTPGSLARFEFGHAKGVFSVLSQLEALAPRFVPQPVRPDDLFFEGSELDRELSNVEISLIPKHGVQDPAQPMRDRNDSHLVSPRGGEFSEVGIERMALAKRMVGRFDQHR